jgi:hypothetical protein
MIILSLRAVMEWSQFAMPTGLAVIVALSFVSELLPSRFRSPISSISEMRCRLRSSSISCPTFPCFACAPWSKSRLTVTSPPTVMQAFFLRREQEVVSVSP